MVHKSLRKGNNTPGSGPRVGIWMRDGTAGPELADSKAWGDRAQTLGVTEEGSHHWA